MAAAAAAEAPPTEAAAGPRGSNRIQVSSSKKPMFFYVTLSKRLLAEHGEVHLSALGLAVSTMVSIAEILKHDGLAVETRLATCMDTLGGGGDGRQRPIQKAKMEIWLKKSADFDSLVAAEKENAGGHEEEEEEADGDEHADEDS